MLGANQGPIWNPGERVQVYTHPLWLGVLSAAFFVTRELYFTTLGISIAVSALTLVLIPILARRAELALLVIVGLTVSRAFMDYSTSGLENPLSHSLLVMFALVYVRVKQFRMQLFLLGLVVGLAGLNRLDTLLIYLPFVLWLIVSSDEPYRNVRYLMPGLSLVAFWLVFSLIYYGFPFPNTAYAKLNTGLTAAQQIAQGFRYIGSSLIRDPVTVLLLSLGLGGVIRVRDRSWKMFGSGSILYLVYVISIGGDFMRGRFLALPLLGLLLVFGRLENLRPRKIWSLTLIVLIVGQIAPYPTLTSGSGYGLDRGQADVDRWGISDERGYYYPFTGLLRLDQSRSPESHKWATDGANARRNGEELVIHETLGLLGFYAGRSVHVVDRIGLADPLIARLKPKAEEHWRIGHMHRRLPDGYVETLASGNNLIVDPALREYYERLSLVIKGSIWDYDRLLEIVRFNLGYHDHLLESYQSEASSRAEANPEFSHSR